MSPLDAQEIEAMMDAVQRVKAIETDPERIQVHDDVLFMLALELDDASRTETIHGKRF